MRFEKPGLVGDCGAKGGKSLFIARFLMENQGRLIKAIEPKDVLFYEDPPL